MARKRKSKPTVGRRAEKQRARDRLAHAQDDAQRLGVIDTVPEEALKSARVDPRSQSEQPLPALICTAMRNGWSVPEEKKPELVDELISIAMIGSDSEQPLDAKTLIAKVQAQNALHRGDQMQFERDHPEELAKKNGKIQVGVGIQVNGAGFQEPELTPIEVYQKHLAIEEVIEAAKEKRE